ncbi:MAG TPA: phosphoribosylformylglycinamidine synthase subunit PurS [Bacteroidota bacterium]|nr:phosphoribosylformylglycinamidine synthase subunit PurS [Bacteroidota bacterium]
MYLAKITVTLRKSILDPQGKAVHHALESLRLDDVQEVRIGKFIELNINASRQEDAARITEEACKKLLANPVMEDYSFSLEKVA